MVCYKRDSKGWYLVYPFSQLVSLDFIADVVELVDTADLKSASCWGSNGSSPFIGTTFNMNQKNQKKRDTFEMLIIFLTMLSIVWLLTK